MPKRFVAAGCSNTYSNKVSLFKFPKVPVLRQKWVKQVQRTRAEWSGPSDHSVLCSDHFDSSCFEPDTKLAYNKVSLFKFPKVGVQCSLASSVESVGIQCSLQTMTLDSPPAMILPSTSSPFPSDVPMSESEMSQSGDEIPEHDTSAFTLPEYHNNYIYLLTGMILQLPPVLNQTHHVTLCMIPPYYFSPILLEPECDH